MYDIFIIDFICNTNLLHYNDYNKFAKRMFWQQPQSITLTKQNFVVSKWFKEIINSHSMWCNTLCRTYVMPKWKGKLVRTVKHVVWEGWVNIQAVRVRAPVILMLGLNKRAYALPRAGAEGAPPHYVSFQPKMPTLSCMQSECKFFWPSFGFKEAPYFCAQTKGGINYVYVIGGGWGGPKPMLTPLSKSHLRQWEGHQKR